MTEYKCKKCQIVLYNGREARNHVRKEHGITKDLKNYYIENDRNIASKNNPFYRIGNKVIGKAFNK